MITGAFRRIFSRSIYRFSNVQFHKGEPNYVSNTKDVQLRGVTIKGRFNDLPNMIFFPEICDPIENWIPFFTDGSNKILDYRNVHIVYPRNFGTSDKHPSFDLEDVANDVLRYMWSSKLTTATLAGHGWGAKVALATGCYHSERVTGVFSIDNSPMDQRYFEAYRELRDYVQNLPNIDLSSRAIAHKQLDESVACPKWRSIFKQNIKKAQKSDGFQWAFELDYLRKNMSFNKADSVGYWPVKVGLYPGRAHFVFPEYSRWVHLNTNTIPMLTICPQVKGFGQDIFAYQGDENPLNHWIYDFEESKFAVSRKFQKFLANYDGVHVLLQDRSEIGNYYIPDRVNSRKDSEYYYQDYSPAHVHHNWRFSDVYKKN